MPFTKKFIKYGIISLIIIISLIAFNLPTAQAGSVLPSCAASGRCSVCDIVQTAINIGQFILGIVGAIVLLFFVYGGFVMLTSGGKPDWIKKGKDILINSIIGLLIAFFAYTIVTFVVSAVAKQGWDWQNQLNCAPLPAAIPYTNPDRNTNNTNAAGNTPLDGDCNATAECATGLYCNKAKKCATKLPTTNDSAGQCAGMEVSGDDNLACQSGDCITPQDVVALLVPGGCQPGQCCHSGGTQPVNSVCTAQNCDTGLYCQADSAGATTGKCRPLSTIGQFCNSASVLGGSANEMCATGHCDHEKCVPPNYTKTGGIGVVCTEAGQCQSVVCACANYNTASGKGSGCDVGTCIAKQPECAWCNGWMAGTVLDNFICSSTAGCDEIAPYGTCPDGSSRADKCKP